MRPARNFLPGLALAVFVACVGPCILVGKSPEPEKARLEVHGLGWLRDRDQRLSLERLLGSQRGVTLASNAIEDAAFLLASALESEGFLKPTVEIALTAPDGIKRRFAFDLTLATPLPRDLSAREITFYVTPGVRSVISEVSFIGLSVIKPEAARNHFRPDSALFAQGAARAYTPGRLRREIDALQNELRLRGYAEARVQVRTLNSDDRSGKVSLVVEVTEGPRWDVSELTFAGDLGDGVTLDFATEFTGRPWTPLLQQDLTERIRRAFYRRGYPEVTVALSTRPQAVTERVKPVQVVATVHAGPAVRIGEVRFVGNEHTKESVLRRRIRSKPGDPLNPIVLERSRYRLSRLGIFSAVDLTYEPPQGAVRDPVFQLEETSRKEASLLLGYGSYEQARIGGEFRQLNLFGLGHQSRLELVQSLKSSRGDYTYSVPELFGESVDGAARLFGLQRQEESFLRQEFGVTLALKRQISWGKIEATTGYTYQALRNKENTLATNVADLTDVTVASLDFGLSSDQRDSPLRPRHGFRWFVQLETASRAFGGEADYQRLESGAAFHTSWGNGRWVHLGMTHGIIFTEGARDDRLLPVNKRFFPGGDSSIRGYQSGEASPRDMEGRFIGAKSYLLFNAEVEQALTSNWSAVVFSDALGMSARIGSGPVDEQLYSAGVGIRYQTLIGPIRLEYGHNLNPRPRDPSGTLHFSVGFPF